MNFFAGELVINIIIMNQLITEGKTRTNSRVNKRVHSQQNVLLPYLAPPDDNHEEKKKPKFFDLGGMYNASLPKYEPLRDKNLKFFFEKPTVKRIINRNHEVVSRNHEFLKPQSNLSHNR